MGSFHGRNSVWRGLRFVLLFLALVITTDLVAGFWYRSGTSAQLHVVEAKVGHATTVLVVFPGFAMPGDLLADAFRPYLASTEAMIVVKHADRGVNMDDIASRVAAEVRRLGPSVLKVYGASMGGMCAREFLLRQNPASMNVARSTLILDSVPSSARQVKQPKWMFQLARWYRGGPVSTTAWATVHQAVSQSQPAEPSANPELISRARNAGSWAGIPALSSQATFIAEFPPLNDGELTGLVDKIIYLRGIGDDNDRLIKLEPSILDWKRVHPNFEAVILPGRDVRWHVPLIERPAETMAAIAAA